MASDSPPFPWLPGEHVAAIGDTGTGKTYLLSKALLRMRTYVIVLKTKADDDEKTKWEGFHRITRASGMNDERYTRFLLDPKYEHQAIEGYKMFERAWRHGGWTVVVDEGLYTERLGLAPYIERLLTQGRSTGISVVFGQQRPVGTSRFVISQCTHVFSFRVEGRDAETIAEATTPRVLPFLSEKYADRHPDEAHKLLGKYQFVYYNRASRAVVTGSARTMGGILRASGKIGTKTA